MTKSTKKTTTASEAVERISGAELARRLGVSRTAVHEATATGRLTRDAEGLYNVERAPLDWEVNRGRKPTVGAHAPEKTAGVLRWDEALKRERAKKAKLERLELQGLLIRRRVVESGVAELAVLVRDRLRLIPAKLAARIAAETDPRTCREMMATEIDKALVALADMAAPRAQGAA